MLRIAWLAVSHFFKSMSTPLNRGEQDQPPPLTAREAALAQELEHVRRDLRAGRVSEATKDRPDVP